MAWVAARWWVGAESTSRGAETVANLEISAPERIFCVIDTLTTRGTEKLEANLAKGFCTSS